MCLQSLFNITGIITGMDQIDQKPADGHICNRIKIVKYYPELIIKFSFIILLQFRLRRWQECTNRVIDKIKFQS